MDLFDILWLVVCLGLPVISGIAASAEKKKKAQGRPVVTQEPEGNDLPSWMEILTGQPMEAALTLPNSNAASLIDTNE